MTANLLLNLLFCVTPRNRSRQVRSISTRYSLKRNLRKVNNKGNTLRELTCVAMVMSFAVNKDALWGKKKRNFMVGQIKQKNQNISLFPMFYFETKLPLLTAVLYLVFISNPNVFLNKSLNSFLVHHLNWINDFRHLPLTLAEMS